MAKKYISERKVSQDTGFALQTLRNWRHQGRGPAFIRISGRAIRYCEEDVIKWMESHRVEPDRD